LAIGRTFPGQNETTLLAKTENGYLVLKNPPEWLEYFELWLDSPHTDEEMSVFFFIQTKRVIWMIALLIQAIQAVMREMTAAKIRQRLVTLVNKLDL